MTDRNFHEMEIAWSLMTPMESALWGTTLAIHAADPDGGLRTADAALAKLRELGSIRSHRPDPEFEAARSGFIVEREDFSVWYLVEHRMRYGRERDYKPPSASDIALAFERYERGRCDYY